MLDRELLYSARIGLKRQTDSCCSPPHTKKKDCLVGDIESFFREGSMRPIGLSRIKQNFPELFLSPLKDCEYVDGGLGHCAKCGYNGNDHCYCEDNTWVQPDKKRSPLPRNEKDFTKMLEEYWFPPKENSPLRNQLPEKYIFVVIVHEAFRHMSGFPPADLVFNDQIDWSSEFNNWSRETTFTFKTESAKMADYIPQAIKLGANKNDLNVVPRGVEINGSIQKTTVEIVPQAIKLAPRPAPVASSACLMSTPQAVKIEPKPIVQTPKHEPSAIMKPRVIFEGFKFTEAEVVAVVPELNSAEAKLIIDLASKISCTDYDKTIPDIGVKHQEMLAAVPERLNTVVPKDGIVDQSIDALQTIKEMVESIQIKKSFITKLFSSVKDIDKTKALIKAKTAELRRYMTGLDALNNEIDEIENRLVGCRDAISCNFNLIKVLKTKAKNVDQLLDSRLSSLYISITIAEQTKQLIGLKTKNIKAIISTIRDTLLTSIPSWFNQIEILEQMEVSNAIDENLVKSLMENQEQILKQLSQFSTKG